jgi:hypothetical protein
VTLANLEIAAATDTPGMKASLEIQAAREEPEIKAGKVATDGKAGTRHVQPASIATPTPRLGKRAASETNNLTGSSVSGFALDCKRTTIRRPCRGGGLLCSMATVPHRRHFQVKIRDSFLKLAPARSGSSD